MENLHRRSSSVPLLTPFHDFSLRVNTLRNSALATNLRRWNDGQEIERALLQLHDAVRRIEISNGRNGPLLSWNTPTYPTSSTHLSSSAHMNDPYTPPRTPASNSTRDGSAQSVRARMDDLRYRLERANVEIDSLSQSLATTRASLSVATAAEQALRTEISTRNQTIADQREIIAKQHQRLSRQRDSVHPSRSATPTSEQRQSKPSNGYTRHSLSRSPHRGSDTRRHTMSTPAELDLEIATLNALLKRGKHDEAEVLARSLLHGSDITLTTATKRTLGWTIALLCERQQKHAEAQRFLMSLPQRTASDQAPRDETVLAMLAYIELKLRDLSSAENHARMLWKKYRLQYDERWHGFHPADTLIQTLALKKNSEDPTRGYWEAEGLWRAIYDDVVRSGSGEREGSGWKDKVRKHADAGMQLSRAWKESCEQRGKVPRTAEVVRAQAEEMKRLGS